MKKKDEINARLLSKDSGRCSRRAQNIILGSTQEYRAQTSIEALRRIAVPKAKVLRDGARIQAETAKLVPGDIIFLDTGDKVPADARLIEAMNLQVQEVLSYWRINAHIKRTGYFLRQQPRLYS